MLGSKTPGNDEAEMGFFDHVEVLRWHLIRAGAAIIVASCGIGFFYEYIFDHVILAVQHKEFPTYRFLCWVSQHVPYTKDICIDKDIPLQLQNIAMFGQITMLIEYSMILGFVIAFPYVIWEIWRFISPALKPEDQAKVSNVILASSAFFFVGIIFCYFVIIPLCVNFAATFSVSPTIHNVFTIDNYIDFFTMMLLSIGAVFELPMVVYFLSKVGILKASAMRKVRRYAILVIAIVAGMIAPSPDVFTQCLIGVPIYLLYEFSIFVAARNERKREAKV